jgi:anti-repressor protein
MNELIAVCTRQIGNEAVPTVDARDLHKFLESGKDFSSWIKFRIEQFDFSEGVDYVVFPQTGERDSKGWNSKIEYHLTLDMAREISMVERSQKGKEARLYFIECERRAKAAERQPLPIARPRLPDFAHPIAAARAWADQAEARILH